MANASLNTIVAHCDRMLRTADIKDYDRAANGLQVENRGTITRIAAAVDASLATVTLAVRAKADLLIVHHGLFWGASHPWTGKRYELLQLLLEHDMAVYSSHLPLDAHPKLGNNARLCAALGLRKLRPFFLDRGQYLGFQSQARISRSELADRLQRAGRLVGVDGRHLLFELDQRLAVGTTQAVPVPRRRSVDRREGFTCRSEPRGCGSYENGIRGDARH